jgi:hypothetical protein
MADFVRICEDAGAIKSFKEDKHELILPNDCKIIFRPLSLKRANFKGMHLCGFLIDDPDVVKYADTISFLWSRLRNPPNVQAVRFQTIITSNWEGRNWLWKTYMRERKPGGDGEFAWWLCPTTDNPTLPENYIKDLAMIHSKEWMDRYVHCSNLKSNIGLIYYDINPEVHHVDASIVEERKDLIRILAVDVGSVHATVVLKMATDGRDVFTYGEWYRKGIKVSHLGEYLRKELQKDIYTRVVIDPSSAKGEMVAGTSIKHELRRNYGIHTVGADNNVIYGINFTRDLLKPATGKPRTFIDFNACPNLHRETDMYRWKEPRNMDYDDMDYREEPVKKNDDAVDAWRYGTVFFKRYLKGLQVDDLQAANLKRYREDKLRNSKFFDLHPGGRKEAKLVNTYERLGFNKKRINELLASQN